MVKLKEYLGNETTFSLLRTYFYKESVNVKQVDLCKNSVLNLDTTFRRGGKLKSPPPGSDLTTPSPTKSGSFIYDRIPDSLSSPSYSSLNGFRSRSPSLEFKTTLIDPMLISTNGHYRECFSCKMPIYDVVELL